MTGRRPAPASAEGAAVGVRTVRRPAAPAGALPAYLALADLLGPAEVFLLETTAGPAPGTRRRYTGFGAVLTVAVTRGAVRVEGAPQLRAAVLDRLRPLLATVDGGLLLREPGDLWQVLRTVQRTFDAAGSAEEFRFGFLGYFGYDAVRYIEQLPHLIEPASDLPDAQLTLFQGCLVSDVDTGTAELLLHESPAWPALDADRVLAVLAAADRTHPAPAPAAVPPAEVHDDTARDDFLEVVARCQDHIAVGDIYQVQIGHELTMRSELDPVAAYQRLCARNPSPYTYLSTVAGHTVIGASPESFVTVRDGEIVMRPIAGTVPRGGADDEVAARRLRADPKELAEHVMLIDLCRNDIGRICRRDTLEVPEQLTVERYSHVLHLVSTVTGRAEPDADAFDIVPALFPAGTMSGAPKIRAMEIIESMERSRRGLYGGALGLLDVGGYLDLALCIRTLIHHDGSYRTRASAGIVADSVPGREWTETLAKSSAAYWAVTGEELL